MISIVTIVLNQVDEIESTLLSVISQRNENLKIQYVVIDGGSIDGTLDIINLYSDKIDVIQSGKDGGIFPAINKGIKLCKFPLVGLIHCGDKYLPGTLQRVFKMYEDTNADVLFGDMLIKTKLNDVDIIQVVKPELHNLKTKMSIFHPSTFIKLDIFSEFGLYNVIYKSSSDYDYLLRLYLLNRRFTYVDFVIAEYAAGGNSEINFKSVVKDNFYIRLRNLGRYSAIVYLINFISRHYIYNTRRKILIFLLGERRYNQFKIYKISKINRVLL
jgi:glycosyltransferase involved in cell wall biosynthesis